MTIQKQNPSPGRQVPEETPRPVSRQRLWQRKQRAEGLCILGCGRSTTANLCQACYLQYKRIPLLTRQVENRKLKLAAAQAELAAILRREQKKKKTA